MKTEQDSRPLRLFLVRHGRVAANRDFRYIGSSDDELDDQGMRQAEDLGRALAGLNADALISSPVRRCLQTAERIQASLGGEAKVDSRLAEQDFGAWQGCTRSEIRSTEEGACALEAFDKDPHTAPPQGESWHGMSERVLEVLQALGGSAATRRVVIVSHVGPIKALVAAALGVDWAASRRLFLDPGSLSVVDWSPHRVVRLFNAGCDAQWKERAWAIPDWKTT